MKLIVASNNAHKVREIKEILSGRFEEVLSLKDAGISIDVIEDGKTFTENARKKATAILAVTGSDYAVLADDSGLMVDALDGAPGVYSARFAEGGHDDEANNRKLLDLMSTVPDEKRGCAFHCAMVLARNGKPNIEVSGSCHGSLLREKRGENGFGYDPLFFSPEFGVSFAELAAEQKNSISHRKRALEAVISMLDAESSCPDTV